MIYLHRSFSAQSRQRIFVAYCVIATLLFVVLSTSSPPPAVKAKSEKSGAYFVSVSKTQKAGNGCCGTEEGDEKPHLLAGSYYTLKNGFSAKLLLNNKGPSSIEVKPTLFALSGEEFDAPAVIVAGNSYQFINFADWANAAGPQFQEGSIQVFHRGKDLVLGTQIYLTNDAHNLGFERSSLNRQHRNQPGWQAFGGSRHRKEPWNWSYRTQQRVHCRLQSEFEAKLPNGKVS